MIVGLAKIVALLAAAAIVGNWYLSEVKKAKKQNAVWYRPYISPPGLIIISAIVFLPVLAWLFGK